MMLVRIQINQQQIQVTRTMQSQMLDWNIIIMVEKFCKTRVLSDNYSFLDQSMPGAVIDGSTWD